MPNAVRNDRILLAKIARKAILNKFVKFIGLNYSSVLAGKAASPSAALKILLLISSLIYIQVLKLKQKKILYQMKLFW